MLGNSDTGGSILTAIIFNVSNLLDLIVSSVFFKLRIFKQVLFWALLHNTTLQTTEDSNVQFFF